MLPCNVTVEEAPQGGSLVRIANPEMLILTGDLGQNPELMEAARVVRQKLEKVAEALRDMSLNGRTVLITGAARRIGRSLALAVAQQGGDVILHHGHSAQEAEDLRRRIIELGRKAEIISADLEQPERLHVWSTRHSKSPRFTLWSITRPSSSRWIGRTPAWKPGTVTWRST